MEAGPGDGAHIEWLRTELGTKRDWGGNTVRDRQEAGPPSENGSGLYGVTEQQVWGPKWLGLRYGSGPREQYQDWIVLDRSGLNLREGLS